MRTKLSVLVVGAGVFGLTSAIELASRGYEITVIDPGTVPNPRAASTDISKAIRMDYGSDELYMSLMEEALVVWDEWNREWNEPLYHEDGFLVLSSAEMMPDSFEFDSFRMLQKHGYSPRRLSSATLREKFPAWNADNYQDGYFNPRAGWGESAKVVARLLQGAEALGVSVRQNVSAVRLQENSKQVTGVIGSDSEVYAADLVIVAMGTWSPLLAPRLASIITHVAQPIFYFRPENTDLYEGHQFPVWASNLSKTGWYGFPVNRDGIVKVSNHGPGRAVHPDVAREIAPEDEVKCRKFLSENLPSLGDVPLASSRVCLYCDSWDGNFYIDHDPELPGLVYATGGSGHAFKFTPVLGRLVADVVERKPNPYTSRFAWRERGIAAVKEQARCQGS